MSDVIEVANAEQITGHNHSILIQTTDLSTFVKGTCSEESKWWYNVLVQYVKSKVRHHKRNILLKGHQQKCRYNLNNTLVRSLFNKNTSKRNQNKRDITLEFAFNS